MKVKNHLIINARGSARVTKRRPGLEWDEIAIALDIELPDALFRKPHLSASITIPNEAARPNIIEAVTAENVQDAINESTGLEFVIRIAPPEPTE